MNIINTSIIGLVFLVACGGDDAGGISSTISPTQGGSLQLEGTETGITFPEGAVETEVEVSLSLGSIADFAPRENALNDVLVFSPELLLTASASMTFEIGDSFDSSTQRAHIEQFVDGVWLRPEISSLEVGSGGVAFGSLQSLSPTAIVVTDIPLD
ncbi:MAG: hypothetical protein JKY56_10170 [Kofleriaceae bacterium]|nr:hypothetical protein [Kofleriaceae bacterium]